MAKRPMCLLCFLMVLSLGVLELMGIPLIKGNQIGRASCRERV